MKKFADLWKGMFYLVSTVSMAIVLYLVVVVWQPLWTEGFKDFGNIAKAIRHLDRTAKPVAEMAPLMLGEMDEMRQSMVAMQASLKTVEDMNDTIKNMNYIMARMTWVMDHRMDTMSGEMNEMGDKFSPVGMMPFNW